MAYDGRCCARECVKAGFDSKTLKTRRIALNCARSVRIAWLKHGHMPDPYEVAMGERYGPGGLLGHWGHECPTYVWRKVSP